MPPPPDLSSFVLPEETSTDIFTTQIIPSDLANLAPSPSNQQPLAVLLVGQTGAGKTRFALPIRDALASRRGTAPAHFIADTYKIYHPSFKTLMSSPSTAPHASMAASPDARRWLRLAVRRAATRRYDVLLESASVHPDDFAHFSTVLYEAGYHVQAVLLAVPEVLSRIGVLTRFYEKLPEAASRGMPARLTPRKVHDNSYAGMLTAAEWIDENGEKLDRVLVVRRGNLVAFADDKRTQYGRLRGLAADAIRRERRRPLTGTERQVAEDDIARLEAPCPEQAVDMRLMLDALGESDTAGEVFPQLKPLEFRRDGEDGNDGFLILGDK